MREENIETTGDIETVIFQEKRHKKIGIVSLLTSVVAIIPSLGVIYIDYLNSQNDNLKAHITENINAIQKELEHNLRIAIDAHTRGYVSKDQMMAIIREKIGYASIWKREWLEDAMRKGIRDQEYFKSLIDAELQKRSNVYIEELNQYVVNEHGIGSLVSEFWTQGDYWEQFINDIVYIAYSEGSVDSKGDKIFYQVMLGRQNDMMKYFDELLKNTPVLNKAKPKEYK
jgi:hypothetical protein